MKKFDLITPEGTRDIILEDCSARRSVEEKLYNIFKSKGYREVVTPGLEFYDVFDLNSIYYPQESMYKLVDGKGRLMVVRPDTTMPIARVVATRLKDQIMPLRLFYSQSVFRMKPAMRGRSDEILQSGIELIGSSSKRADLEVLTTAVEVLSSCDNEKFRLEIGDIGFFKELVSRLGTDDDTVEEIRRLIEVKNYPALNDLLDSIGDNEVTNALKQLPRLFGGEEVFEKAAQLISDDKTDEILSSLHWIYKELAKLGHNGKISVDLGIVNKLDYYTGIVMKGYLQGFGDNVLSGGRYDHLIKEFGMDMPATGFAVNVDAVAKVMSAKQEIHLTPSDAVVFGEDGYETEAIKEADKLIAQGLVVENAVFDKLDDVLAYAEEKHINKVYVVSDSVKIIEIGGGRNAE